MESDFHLALFPAFAQFFVVCSLKKVGEGLVT